MQSLQKLVGAYRRWTEEQKPNPDIPRVQVDNIAARVAVFYEKVRGIVGWTEEHLLRQSAIVRILRRSMMVAEGESAIAETLVKDLVRGGYFPNATIPEARVTELERVIGKYLFLFERIRARAPRERGNLENWLSGIAAAEVEAFLDPPFREEALLEFATEDLERRITLQKPIPAQERENLIFIAIRQSLYKFDEPIITYQLLERYIPGWSMLSSLGPGRETLEQFAAEIGRWHGSITRAFRHSLSERFYWAASAIDTPYLILGDLLSDLAKKEELTEEALPEGDALVDRVLAAYRVRTAAQTGKSLRAAFYSTLSIFTSKIVLAFAVEIPIDRLTGELQSATIIANIAIPPILMIALVFLGFTKPTRRDANRVVEELNRILAGNPSPYHIRLPGRRSIFLQGLVGLLYVAGAATTFGVIIWALTRLHFSMLSQGIFIFFVSLIAYAGLRIRERSKELIVAEKPPGILHDIILFFTFPIVELGRWLSGALLKIRLVALLLDALIELPLKFFLEFLEQWRAFLREKKERIR